MNVFLMTDVEGIPGVFSIDDIDRTSEGYSRVRRLLTDHINELARLCKKHGADNIFFLDGHAGGGNVFDEEIHSIAQKVSVEEWAKLLSEGKIDCAIEAGCHARAGTYLGFLDHTFNSQRVFEYEINGVVHSELSSHALFAGLFGVPTVMCIGDQTACDQAREYLPDIVTVATKKASSRNNCLALENISERLDEAVKNALSGYKTAKPFVTEGDRLRVKMTFYRSDMCESVMARAKYPCTRTDARTLERELEKSSVDRFAKLVF